MAPHLILIGLAMGALLSIYVPLISRSAQLLGSGPMGNVPFFAIALMSSILIAIATGSRAADFQKIFSLPPLLLTAGVMSACMIIGSSFLVPRVGISGFVVLAVAGQILAGLVFGYLGLFGAPQVDLNLIKTSGALLVVVGVALYTLA